MKIKLNYDDSLLESSDQGSRKNHNRQATDKPPQVSSLKSTVMADRAGIRKFREFIDKKGSKFIRQTLNESSDPYKSAIPSLQSSLALDFPKCTPALSFLDAIDYPRSSVYQSLLENSKSKLNGFIEAMEDISLLKLLLEETISFMAVKEMMSIPISVIKRLKVNDIPPKYLKMLAKQKLLSV